MRVQVFIAVHCPPKVLKLTLGSWLEFYDGSYEVEVHLGLHSNYTDYHQGLDELMALEGHVELHFVDEIDWYAVGLTRYSEMHARNLLNMMRAVKDREFDYAFVFDHDLLFKRDFIRWVLDCYSGVDLLGCLLDDVDYPRRFQSHDGPFYTFFSKLSVWHMMMSHRCFDCVLACPEAILPQQIGSEVYDTFSKGLEWARHDWGLNVEILKSIELEDIVHHWWSASLNFGKSFDKDYEGKIRRIEGEYDKRFPEGMKHLFAKIRGELGV